MRPATAHASRPLHAPAQQQQNQRRRTQPPASSAPPAAALRLRNSHITSARPSTIDAFESEVSGTISRLQRVTGWNFGERARREATRARKCN